MCDIHLGMDIGASNSRIMAKDADGKVVWFKTLTTPRAYEPLLDTLADAIDSERRAGDTIRAIGVGIAGAVTDGEVTGSGNLPYLVGQNLQLDMKKRFEVPVVVMNDCAAAALGDYSLCQLPHVNVTLGTGIGGSVVMIGSDGRAFTMGTEAGHMVIDRSSTLQCGCGEYGDLEALTGGINMLQRFGKEGKDLDIFDWLKVLADLADGFATLAKMFMGLPIVIGGGVADHLFAEPHRLALLQEMVAALPMTCATPTLLLSEAGGDSGVLGACFAAGELVIDL